MFGASPGKLRSLLAALQIAKGYRMEESVNWLVVYKEVEGDKGTTIWYRPCREIDTKMAIKQGWTVISYDTTDNLSPSIKILKRLLPKELTDRYIKQSTIEKDHPSHKNSRLDAGEHYAVATVLVSERYDKYDLVGLVNHLLHEIDRVKEEIPKSIADMKIDRLEKLKKAERPCRSCGKNLCIKGCCHNDKCSSYYIHLNNCDCI